MVLTASWLFPATGSFGEAAVTETLFVMVPCEVGFTVMATVAVRLLASEPRLQVSRRFAGLRVQVPWVVLNVPYPAFLGRLSVSVTPMASAGPLLVTRMVYVKVLPHYWLRSAAVSSPLRPLRSRFGELRQRTAG
jgi:hypothetical protein